MSDRVFHIGQLVRVIKGPRAGEVGRVTSDLELAGPKVRPPGVLQPLDLVHRLDLLPMFGGQFVIAPPSWLEPYDDGREPLAESETEEWIRRLVRPARVKV